LLRRDYDVIEPRDVIKKRHRSTHREQFPIGSLLVTNPYGLQFPRYLSSKLPTHTHTHTQTSGSTDSKGRLKLSNHASQLNRKFILRNILDASPLRWMHCSVIKMVLRVCFTKSDRQGHKTQSVVSSWPSGPSHRKPGHTGGRMQFADSAVQSSWMMFGWSYRSRLLTAVTGMQIVERKGM